MERKLAEFQLIKSLGQGAMGKVYLAEHVFMKKQFALKVLPEDLSTDRSFVQRFELEIGQLAQLEHPSIARMHQVAFSDGLYYIVMDLAVGPEGEPFNLQQYLNARKEPLSEEEILNLLKQVASALDYAHARKRQDGQPLAHLSLRPTNILVTGKLTQPRFVLTDFGLHRLVGPGRVLSYFMGGLAKEMEEQTPVSSESHDAAHDARVLEFRQQSFYRAMQFLAPEQKRPEQAQESSCDVYAFGVLAYYLLVRDFPEGVFELPSLVRDDLEYNWDRMIMSCLNSRAQRRPKSLTGLLEAVQSSLQAVAPEPAQQTFRPPLQAQKPQTAPVMKPLQAPVAPKAPEFERHSTTKLVISSAAQAYQRALEGTPPAAEEPEVPSVSKGHSQMSPAMALDAASAAASFPAGQSAVVSGPIQRPTPAAASTPSAAPSPPVAPPVHPAGVESKEEDTQLSPHVIVKNNPALGTSSYVYIGSSTARASTPTDTGSETEPLLTSMRFIQGGRYLRGSNEGSRDEMPRHAIVISDFSIDVHPVTNEQFVRFLRTKGVEKDESNNDMIRLKESRIKRVGGKLLIEPGYQRHPVVGVTWYGALSYSKWIGKRLPTEAEWEIAARGGIEDAIYPTGENIEKTQANFFNNDTTAVMSYPPNGYELYDMSGNVYEWCQDWYAYNTYELTISEPMMPQGPLQGVYRVLRGGCWKSLKEDLRCSHRHRNNPGAVNRTYGFRCVSDAQPTSGSDGVSGRRVEATQTHFRLG